MVNNKPQKIPQKHHKGLTRTRIEALCAQIEAGNGYLVACALVGMSRSSFSYWMRKGREAVLTIDENTGDDSHLNDRQRMCIVLLRSVEKAEATAEARSISLIRNAAINSWQAAAWWLERKHPGRYSLNPDLRRETEEAQLDLFGSARPLIAAMAGTMRGINPGGSILPEAWSVYRWTEPQLRALDSESRFLGLPCGRGSGKTDMSLRRLVMASAIKTKWGDPRYFYAAPTNPQAMRVAWDRLLELFPKHWVRIPRRSDQYIETIFNSRVYVLGMDAPQRIEGVQWNGGIVDESSDQRPGAFDKSIRPALTHRKAWCWRIGVPKRYGLGAQEYKAWCDAGMRGDMDDTEIHRWFSSEVLPAEEITAARKSLDPRDFREQFEASWETAGGGIFYAFDSSHNVSPVVYNPELPLCVACDFNVDPMAWVICQRYENSLWCIDEIFERDTNTQKCMDILWSRYGHHMSGFEFYGDASGHARKTSSTFTDWAIIAGDSRFKNAGRNMYAARVDPPRKSRFAATNAMFENAEGERRCLINPNCVWLVRDIEARSYKPGTMEPNDPPGGDVGHMTDALGYLIWRLWPIQLELDEPPPMVIMTSGARRN